MIIDEIYNELTEDQKIRAIRREFIDLTLRLYGISKETKDVDKYSALKDIEGALRSARRVLDTL